MCDVNIGKKTARPREGFLLSTSFLLNEEYTRLRYYELDRCLIDSQAQIPKVSQDVRVNVIWYDLLWLECLKGRRFLSEQKFRNGRHGSKHFLRIEFLKNPRIGRIYFWFPMKSEQFNRASDFPRATANGREFRRLIRKVNRLSWESHKTPVSVSFWSDRMAKHRASVWSVAWNYSLGYFALLAFVIHFCRFWCLQFSPSVNQGTFSYSINVF